MCGAGRSVPGCWGSGPRGAHQHLSGAANNSCVRDGGRHEGPDSPQPLRPGPSDPMAAWPHACRRGGTPSGQPLLTNTLNRSQKIREAAARQPQPQRSPPTSHHGALTLLYLSYISALERRRPPPDWPRAAEAAASAGPAAGRHEVQLAAPRWAKFSTFRSLRV